MKENKKLVPVSVETLRLISRGLAPQKIKIESLIEDHYKGTFRVSEMVLLSLLELKATASLLDEMLARLFDFAEESAAATLQMLPEEVTLLATLGKTLSAGDKLSPSITLLTQ